MPFGCFLGKCIYLKIPLKIVCFHCIVCAHEVIPLYTYILRCFGLLRIDKMLSAKIYFHKGTVNFVWFYRYFKATFQLKWWTMAMLDAKTVALYLFFFSLAGAKSILPSSLPSPPSPSTSMPTYGYCQKNHKWNQLLVESQYGK